MTKSRKSKPSATGVELTTQVYAADARPAEFWLAMGPIFASKAIRKELPWLVDEPGRVWFVLTAPAGVAAFLSVTTKDATATLHSPWVHPDLRADASVGERLLTTVVRDLVNRDCTRVMTTVDAHQFVLLSRAGFQTTSKRGSYSVMEKSL